MTRSVKSSSTREFIAAHFGNRRIVRMTNQFAVIVGAAIIALTILLGNVSDSYQISAGTDSHGNPFVWRVNVRSGKIQNCYLDRNAPSAEAQPQGSPPKMIIQCNPD
jgi:hypothetical protein